MGPLSVPKLAAQSISAIYNPCKDLFLYVMGRRQEIKDLNDNIRTLITDLITIMSRKDEIEQFLSTSVSKEKSNEFKIMEKDIAGINKRYIKFITKYAKITNNLPGAAELNVSTATDIIDKLEDINTKIWTLNFWKLAKLSRDIAKLSKRASGIVDRLMKPEHMTRKKPETHQEKLHDGTDLQVFNKYVDEVLRYLSEDGNRVGILGPAGSGKTTVLTRLYNRLIDTKLSDGNSSLRLDYIIRTEYPSELGTNESIVQKLQNEIMMQLKINHESTNSVYQNADIISRFLHHKKYILLMDNVSCRIDLNKLGLRGDHNYGKIVIASSDKKAVSLMIEHEVNIERLLKEDGWKLLENICGKIYDPRRREIADRIIDCCGGIPYEIRFVSNFLKKHNDESSWNDAKTILQSDTKSLDLLGLGGMDNVYRRAYEKLEVGSKKCLVYGALFPHQHRIYRDYLIECWMAEGFIAENANQKLRRNRERGQTILGQLTEEYMLEWCSDTRYVKMPPNFRRVALKLEYPDEKESVIWVPSNDLKPDEDTWKTVTRMSLIGCKTKLPESPKCLNICTLLLQFKPELERLTDLFFLHMQSLKILDLNHTKIGALPSSINSLVNLRSLYLNGCNHLDMLPREAKELKKLEFLDICGTSIPSFPQEIKSMVDLRGLRASFSPRACSCNSIGKEQNDPEVIIPTNIISNLKKLEELSIDTGHHSMIDVAEELAMELASLEHLNTLCFNFPNVSSLETFVTNSKSLENLETSWGTHTFRSFKIFVGCHKTQQPFEYDVSEVSAERRLRCSTNEGFSSACTKLMQQASALELIGNDSVNSLSVFDLHSLKVCVVGSCSRLRKIVDGCTMNEIDGITEECSGAVLQNLEKLHLYDLQSLDCIWEGPVVPQSLINLTVLTVNGCPKLKKILDPELARTLPRLKHIKAEDCLEMSEIVGVSEQFNNSEQVDPSGIFKSVEIVEISNLPKLQSICKSTSIKWVSLKSLIIIRCSELRNLSLTQTNARKLASVECEESWWAPLQLPDGVKQHLSSFCCFKEESPALGARPEGETSTSGRKSVFDPVIAQGGKEIADQEIKLKNSHPIGLPTSNMNLDIGAKSLKEEMSNHYDLPAFETDSESDSPGSYGTSATFESIANDLCIKAGSTSKPGHCATSA